MVDAILFKIGFFLINLDITFCILGLIGFIFIKKTWGKALSASSFLLFSLMQTTNSYEFLAKNLENYYPIPEIQQEEIEGFILLGDTYNLKQSTPQKAIFNLAGSRLFEFIKLAQKYPDKKVVFTGTKLEADITKQYFKDFDIQEERMLIDNKARNTEDNAQNVAKLLGGDKYKKWVLVTSAFHMKRSAALFKDVGVNITPYPVDFHVSESPSLSLSKAGNIFYFAIIKEYMGLLALWRKGIKI